MFLEIALLACLIMFDNILCETETDQIIEKCFASYSEMSIEKSKALANDIGYMEDDKDLSFEQSLDYEINHTGDVLLINNQTYSCICRMRPPQCLPLCPIVNDTLPDVSNNTNMDKYYIDLILSNGTTVKRHIINDFRTAIYTGFCYDSYELSPEKDPKFNWSLFENGTLLRHHDQTYLTDKEYCFDIDNKSGYINPRNCPIVYEMSLLDWFSNVSMVISIPFFLLTLMPYCIFPELCNIHGKCFISYLCSITLSYSLISFINLSGIQWDVVPCYILGFLNHYLQLAHYTWVGIISYDTWQSFSNLTYDPYYGRYAAFGWTAPLAWTLMTLVAQCAPMPETFKPGITPEHCGLEANKWAATIYLYGPCFLVLLFSLFAFIYTTHSITINVQDANLYKRAKDCQRIRYPLYLRLFLVMGLSWSMDAVSYICQMLEYKKVFYFAEFVNAFQGLYIFIHFILRTQVRQLIEKRWYAKYESTLALTYRPTTSSS